jgi:branched-chain amino acid transport system permease protein
MEAFVAFTFSGLVLGGVYGLLAVGMTLVLLVSDTIHFAYGETVVMSMYVGWWIAKLTGIPVLVFPAVIVSAVIINYLLEPLLRRSRQQHSFLEALVITIAGAMILSELMSHQFNSGMAIAFPGSVTGGELSVSLGLVKVDVSDLYVLGGVIATLVALLYFLYRTKRGKGLRAIAQNIEVAQMLGIPVSRGAILGHVVGGLMAGVTGLLLIASFRVASPDLGQEVTFKGMAIMMLAGMGNLQGAVIGGFILGLIESYVKGYFIGDWADAISMGVILAVILVRPGGLFGAKR